jgi:hypothetical protein
MFVTDFAGSVYSADLDGNNERNFLYAQGNLTRHRLCRNVGRIPNDDR